MVSFSSALVVFVCIVSTAQAYYYYPGYTAYFQQDPRAAAYAQQQGFNVGYPGLQQQLALQQQMLRQQLMAQQYGGYGYSMDPMMQQQLLQRQMMMMNPMAAYGNYAGYGRPYSPFQQAQKVTAAKS